MAPRFRISPRDVLQVAEATRPACFTGEGMLLLADGSLIAVRDARVGDAVITESGGARAIARIDFNLVRDVRSMVRIQGVWLTPGHPVLAKGEWVHPFEVGRVERVWVEALFNFELEGGPAAEDHSCVINGLVVCTLGKDCGARITAGWPREDVLFGRGYWGSSSPNTASSV